MKITFTFCAYTLLDGTDDEIPTPQALDGQSLKDYDSNDFNLSQYFDFELAEAGIIGGSIRVIVRDGEARIAVDYWAPPGLSDVFLAELRRDALGHMSDGAGGSGFQVEAEGKNLLLFADWQAPDPATLEITDDGRQVPTPSPVAIAACKGDIEGLLAAIEADPSAIDVPLMSWSGLHYAIMYGQLEAAVLLLEAGADPNRLDESFDPSTPLERCALSNDLSDDDSYSLSVLLLERGADPSHVNRKGRTAKDNALIRKKTRTAELL